MGRLATALPYRGTGAGKRMVEALEECIRGGDVGKKARESGEREVSVKAHVQRGLLGFYGRCGYSLEGGEFDEVSRYCLLESRW